MPASYVGLHHLCSHSHQRMLISGQEQHQVGYGCQEPGQARESAVRPGQDQPSHEGDPVTILVSDSPPCYSFSAPCWLSLNHITSSSAPPFIEMSLMHWAPCRMCQSCWPMPWTRLPLTGWSSRQRWSLRAPDPMPSLAPLLWMPACALAHTVSTSQVGPPGQLRNC